MCSWFCPMKKFQVWCTFYKVHCGVCTHCSLLPLSLFIGKLLINFQWLLSWLLRKWRRRLSVSNLSSEKKNCRRFDWMLQSSSGRKWTGKRRKEAGNLLLASFLKPLSCRAYENGLLKCMLERCIHELNFKYLLIQLDLNNVPMGNTPGDHPTCIQ